MEETEWKLMMRQKKGMKLECKWNELIESGKCVYLLGVREKGGKCFGFRGCCWVVESSSFWEWGVNELLQRIAIAQCEREKGLTKWHQNPAAHELIHYFYFYFNIFVKVNLGIIIIMSNNNNLRIII
jgi:hypothetical protein